MRVLKAFLAFWAVVLVPGMAHAEMWKAAGPWQADYGDDYCRLVRDFTDGKDKVSFILERNQPSPFFRVIIVGNAVKTYTRASTVAVQFSALAPRNAPMLRSKTPDDQQYLDLGQSSFMPMPAMGRGAPPARPAPFTNKDELAAAKSATSFAMTTGMVTPITLDTGALDGPLGALQNCVSDLIAQWGIDAKRYETITRPAMPASMASSWVPAGVYPFTEFGKLGGGFNTLLVLVDTAGKPTKCMVQRPTTQEAYNKAACDGIMAKGQFLPALDAAGQPMAGFWITDAFGLFPPMQPGGRR
jgi:hypothetical protein